MVQPRSWNISHYTVKTLKKIINTDTGQVNIPQLGLKTALSTTEKVFVDVLGLWTKWDFPLKLIDCAIVTSYLTSSNKIVPLFKYIMPGEEYAHSFMKWHPQLLVRFCENIKYDHTAVSSDQIHIFSNELEKLLVGVPQSDIVNYDETSFT